VLLKHSALAFKGGNTESKKEPVVQAGKKPYTKPEVRKVVLTLEEGVLGACKNISPNQAGPISSSCTPSTPCYSYGS